jgi:hypothetical protein
MSRFQFASMFASSSMTGETGGVLTKKKVKSGDVCYVLVVR